MEEKTRNGILSTLSVNPPRKQRMSFRQRSVTYIKSFLRAFTREKRYPTCFKFRFVSSPLNAELLELLVEVRVGEPARPPVLVHDEAAGKRERQVFDALELSVAFALPELANFEPVVPRQLESVSEKQADSLRSFGIDPASVRNRGHGSLILKHLYARREAGLATYRQLRYLIR